MSTPDETLVALARQGDRSAREELFRRHWGVAYRVAYRLLGHEHDAHDAVQEGLLKAIAHLDDFDGRSGFRTWLLRIVTNAALDSGRKRNDGGRPAGWATARAMAWSPPSRTTRPGASAARTSAGPSTRPWTA